MHPTPYLFFKDSTRAALAFYADLFGGEIVAMMTFAELPPSEGMDVSDDIKARIMHGAIRWADGGLLMASDSFDEDVEAMAGNMISMSFSTEAAGRAVFDRLAEGGEVGTPYGKTFWAAGFGTVTDQFGTRWMITTSDDEAG